MMNMKPLADRVLIKVEKEQEEKTAGGLVLATKAPAGVPVKGTVVGKGWRHRSDQSRRRPDTEAGRRRADSGL